MAREPLVIVGAGGFGRETAELVHALEERRPQWDLLGFADDGPSLRGTRVSGVPVLGPVAEVVDAHPAARLVLCPGSPVDWTVKRRIEKALAVDVERYATLVHPGASVPRSLTTGPGTVLLAGVVVTADVHIGRHVGVMPGAVLTHDVRVDAFATVTSGVLMAGGAHAQEESYLGAGASIGSRVVVGRGSLVGTGAVVRHDVPPHEVWVGNPARKLRDVSR